MKEPRKVIGFYKRRKIAFALSALVMLCGVIGLFNKGVQLDIQFVSGAVLKYTFEEPVSYDRIRENKKLEQKKSLETLVDESITQTLNRSLNTSLTTVMCVVCLLIFSVLYGITLIKVFALPMLFWSYKWLLFLCVYSRTTLGEMAKSKRKQI